MLLLLSLLLLLYRLYLGPLLLLQQLQSLLIKWLHQHTAAPIIVSPVQHSIIITVTIKWIKEINHITVEPLLNVWILNFRTEDNIPTRDKIDGPKVSSTWRFHTQTDYYNPPPTCTCICTCMLGLIMSIQSYLVSKRNSDKKIDRGCQGSH